MKNIQVKFQVGKSLLDTNLTFKEQALNTLYKLRLALSLFVILTLFTIVMVCYYGSMTYQYHRHPLYEIFHDEKNQNLTRLLSDPNQSKILVKGNFNDGLKIYLGYFANKLTQANQNIVLYNVDDQIIPLQPLVRRMFNGLKNWIGYVSKKTTTRIIVLQKQITNEKIQQIMETYPNDRFIIAQSKQTENQQKLEDFDEVQFQSFEEKLLIGSLITALKISHQQAKALNRHFEDIQKIFELIQSNKFANTNDVLQAVLEGKYNSIKQLSVKNKKLLYKLCKNGTSQIKDSNQLTNFGIKFVNNKIYWQNRLAMLNYELQSHTMCQISGLYSDDDEENQQKQQVKNVQQKKETPIVNQI